MTNRHTTEDTPQPLGPAEPKPVPPKAAEPPWLPMPNHPMHEVQIVDGRRNVRAKDARI